jgi:hypothetical protein
MAPRLAWACGIDVVVESDVGKPFVQVKSSRRGKQEFEGRRKAEYTPRFGSMTGIGSRPDWTPQMTSLRLRP